MRIQIANMIELVLLCEKMTVSAEEQNDPVTREQKILLGQRYARKVLDSGSWLTEDEVRDMHRMLEMTEAPREEPGAPN